MSFTKATKYGTGLGKIYLTTFNDELIASYDNDKTGKEIADTVILASSPVIGETLAVATITYVSGSGTVTDLTIGGVSVFDTGTPISGASLSALATNTATAINSYFSSPNYTAQVLGETVYIFITSGFGSSLNGSALVSTLTGTLAATSTDLDGGTSSQDVVDAQTGIKVWINDSPSAVNGTIVGATDISSFVVRKPFNSPTDIRSYTISGGSIDINRKGSVTEILVDTEGAIASDTLTDIIALGFSNGDTLVIRGVTNARLTTLNTSGNINLANSANFVTGGNESVIVLQYIGGDFWEVSRSPGIPLTVDAFRSANFPQEVLGYKDIELTAGGGTINLTPGVDEKYIRITGSAVTLTSSWTIQGSGTPKQGDTFIVYVDQQITLDGNNVTIFGIPLTSLQASSTQASGNKCVVIGEYVVTWRGTLIANSRGRDLVDTTQLATKEDDLGNPLVNGYILSSDTSGTRAWVDPNSFLNNYDSGWKVMNSHNGTFGFAPVVGWTNPSIRIVGRTVFITGEVLIPLAQTGSSTTLRTPVSDYQNPYNVDTQTFTGTNGGYSVNVNGSITSLSPILPTVLMPTKSITFGRNLFAQRNILDTGNTHVIILNTLFARAILNTDGELVLVTQLDYDDSVGTAITNFPAYQFITKADSGSNVPSYSTYKQQIGGFAVTDSTKTYPADIDGSNPAKLGGYNFLINVCYPIDSSYTESDIITAFNSI